MPECASVPCVWQAVEGDRKSTRLNSSHLVISYAVFCLKKTNNSNAASANTANPAARSLGPRQRMPRPELWLDDSSDLTCTLYPSPLFSTDCFQRSPGAT